MREELYHPMVAHFPIVFFVLALVFKTAELTCFKQKEISEKMNFFCRIVLFTGPFLFLLTMYLGDSALDLIKKDFCQLKLVYDHEEIAKMALPWIILANGFEASSKIEKIKKWKNVLSGATLIALLLINFQMWKTAHTGAMLVYEHGAAVKQSVVNCR